MFKRYDVTLMSNPSCSKKVSDLSADDFRYYDKDGFELNRAEQKFYSSMNFPIGYHILNHNCWQEPWFELEQQDNGLILDHSMFLCRCSYEREAADQLNEIKSKVPQADLLLKTKKKWGFDFSLDAVASDGTIYEVLHIEYDHYEYDIFKNRMISFEYLIRHTDWKDSARRIWDMRDSWQPLKGFDQNNWKSKYLIGWNKSEYTEKSI